MSERWYPTWTQAVSDYRGEDDEAPFDDVTVRMTVPASISGGRVRVELSNRFGDAPVQISHAAVAVGGGASAELTFGGQRSVDLPAGQSRWSDPAELAVAHGDAVVIDIHLPEPTAYATAGGFRYERSLPGDFVGASPFPLEGSTPEAVDEAREFPAPKTGTDSAADESGWSLPAGGPFLRTVEVSGDEPRAVVVCLGGSSTAMGWPQYTAAALPADARIAVVNRGISGNRIRLDAPAAMPSWGQAGLTRFDDDVLGTAGATHLVIAYNSNDWGLPGRVTPIDEMPSLEQLIDGYRQLVDRAEAAGLTVILATVTPLAPEMAEDELREGLRTGLNDWIRSWGGAFVDFDAAIRSTDSPSHLAAEFAAPDSTHPNVAGAKRLAQAMVAALHGAGL
jgi:lysophospholipase L1-like esterase